MEAIRRLGRRFGLGRNPLRRRLDILESRLLAVLAAAFLIGAPLLGITAGQVAHQAGLREEQAQQGWREVPATLLHAAPPGATALVSSLAPARWKIPGGAERTGEIAAPAKAHRGSVVPIWISRQGTLASQPLSPWQATSLAWMIGAMAGLGLAAALALLAALVHLVLNRRRLAAWDADWAATGPRWTRLDPGRM
jgi:MFS family permease